MASIVTSEDISRALAEVGVCAGDVCLFHSSFKSLGSVTGGAQAVIEGFETLLGKEGTLVAPTLCQKDFRNSYRQAQRRRFPDRIFQEADLCLPLQSGDALSCCPRKAGL